MELTPQEEEVLAYLEELVATKAVKLSSDAEPLLIRKFHWINKGSMYGLMMKLAKVMKRRRQEKIEKSGDAVPYAPKMLTAEILTNAKRDLEERYKEYVPKLYNRDLYKPRFEDLSVIPVVNDTNENPIIARASIRISEEMFWYGRKTFWFTYNIWQSGMVLPVEKETELTSPTGKHAYMQPVNEWVEALLAANK